MTKEEAKEFIAQSVKSDVNIAKVAEAIQALEQQPCEDCISRAEALHACCDEWNKDYKAIMKSIRQLPSVTPQQKVGYWEYVQYDNNPNIGNWHCSECRGICTEMHSIEDAYNYCPNCGSKMEVDE